MKSSLHPLIQMSSIQHCALRLCICCVKQAGSMCNDDNLSALQTISSLWQCFKLSVTTARACLFSAYCFVFVRFPLAFAFCPSCTPFCLSARYLLRLQMKAEPSLSGMKEQELKKTVMPFAQMRMKETNQLGPEVNSTVTVKCHSHKTKISWKNIGDKYCSVTVNKVESW